MGVKSESDDIGDDGENNKDETKGDNVPNETSSVTEGTEAVINPTDNSNIPQADSQDAQTYYGENSTVAAAVKADTAETVTSEKETYDLLRERGFTQVSITSEYEMDGTYYEAKAISSTSGKKHPIYQAIYVSSSNEIWSLFVINGAVLANPVSYNMQSKLGVQTIISERDTIMSYDSTSNQFFETVPKSTALNVKKVEKIDAQTLDALTVQAISG